MANLIAYFSRTGENYSSGVIKELKIGNTERAAGMIQKFITADRLKLEMARPYSDSYNECIEEAQKDQKAGVRPELLHLPKSIAQYDTVYLGYPNYWGTMPMAVFTFLERYDFSGRKIRPFCTHEGSGLGSSMKDIQKECPNAEVEEGIAIHGSRIDHAEKEIQEWLKKGEKTL